MKRRMVLFAVLGLCLVLAAGAIWQTKENYERTEIIELMRAAMSSDAKAEFKLGYRFEVGSRLLKMHERNSARLYKRAASKGLAIAQYRLGLLYASGKGVPKDEAKAVGLFKLSAAQKYPPAYGQLGIMYDKGRGVPQDVKWARELWEKGARLGYIPAMVYVGSQSWGRVDESSREERIRRYAWFHLAHSYGSKTAKEWMNVMAPLMSKLDVLQAKVASSRWQSENLRIVPVLNDSP